MSTKIGVMDSGAGGLTILKSIQKNLPNIELIYFADQAHAPYGAKSDAFIVDRLLVVADFFKSQGCCVMVVACNTATVAGIQTLRAKTDLPIVGVEPAVKPACRRSSRKRVSVLATEGTSKSLRLNELIETWRFDTEVQVLASKCLASLIDEMPSALSVAEQEIVRVSTIVKEHQSDALVLACTHYPLIKNMFEVALPGVEIVEPSEGVTAQVRRILLSQGHALSDDFLDDANVAIFTNGAVGFQKSLSYWSQDIEAKNICFVDI
ncbi:MAG: glutamate racemase [Marinomonas sp.]|jgi:glutamate racemase|nr:glutamate racemase [Marinomonas sp.]